MSSHINIRSNQDLTTKELAKTIKKVIGFKAENNFDLNKSDSISRKFLDSEKINNLGS